MIREALMNRYLMALVAGMSLALFPFVAHADDGDKRGFTLRVDGDFTLSRGETARSLVVINGDAQVDGTVRDAVVVINGTANVTGTIEGSVNVINGTLNLQPGANVKDVNLVKSTFNRDERATVTGSVHRRSSVAFRGAWLVFSVVLWAGMTVAVVIAGLVFAAAGGRQLRAAALSMTGDSVPTIVGAVALWIGGPIAGGLLFATVVGIPLSLGLFLFVLPALWFLGYVVAGTRLGGAITGLAGREPSEHPYAAAAVGLILLQLIILVPGIGWLAGALAGFWGSGALVALAMRAARSRPQAPPAAAEPDVEPAGV
jgi:hypothetical protein